ncbi:hypothetical protein AND_001816 [Anopheles darlingi]|uniref:Uncharacterized protein n=1 Tax=Anopheles darlingi TaxID=43151 RepID=W5JQP0_ANODA|nr:hypothetical protein AND_001816 [Anopheles darlingi]
MSPVGCSHSSESVADGDIWRNSSASAVASLLVRCGLGFGSAASKHRHDSERQSLSARPPDSAHTAAAIRSCS